VSDTPRWHFGNAGVDGAEHQGRLVGAFLDPSDVRTTEAVEITWGVHAAGERREAWFEDESQTTLLVLIHGRFEVELPVGNAVLSENGDYAIWGPGMGHAWRAEEDSVVLTITWPPDPSP
jgi:quercetin dioxygenase-like cupin family protein